MKLRTSVGDTIKRMKSMEEIIYSTFYLTEFVTRIYQKKLEIKNRQLNIKIIKIFKIYLVKQYIKIANKCRKMCSTSLVNKKIQIKIKKHTILKLHIFITYPQNGQI